MPEHVFLKFAIVSRHAERVLDLMFCTLTFPCIWTKWKFFRVLPHQIFACEKLKTHARRNDFRKDENRAVWSYCRLITVNANIQCIKGKNRMLRVGIFLWGHNRTYFFQRRCRGKRESWLYCINWNISYFSYRMENNTYTVSIENTYKCSK